MISDTLDEAPPLTREFSGKIVKSDKDYVFEIDNGGLKDKFIYTLTEGKRLPYETEIKGKILILREALKRICDNGPKAWKISFIKHQCMQCMVKIPSYYHP